MNLIKFPEHTATIAESQPQYLPMPVYRFKNDEQGRIACCWKLTWRERFKLLLTGCLWHQILTFGKPLQPQMLTVAKPEMTKPSDG